MSSSIYQKQENLVTSWMKVAEVLLILQLAFLPSAFSVTVTRCTEQADCRHEHGEFCEMRYAHTCQCVEGYLRSEDGTCIPVLLKGEPCIEDEQCAHLDLVCHQFSCGCPEDLKQYDGRCLKTKPDQFGQRPTPPPHLLSVFGSSKEVKNDPRKSPASGGGGYAGPIAICALIFVSFTVLIVTTTYSFKLRNRRLEEVRAILDAHAAHSAANPNARRASIGSIRDAPPSYNTLSPPSYEQAIGQPLTALTGRSTSPSSSSSPSLLRNSSYSLSMEATVNTPMTQMTSPSHRPSYGTAPSAPSKEDQEEASPISSLGNEEENSSRRERY